RLNRPTAWSYYRLGTFALLPDAVERLYANSYKPNSVRPNRANLLVWDLDIARGTAKLREPVSAVSKMEFAAQPMLGVVGGWPAGRRLRADVRPGGHLRRQHGLQRSARGRDRLPAGLSCRRAVVHGRRTRAHGRRRADGRGPRDVDGRGVQRRAQEKRAAHQ